MEADARIKKLKEELTVPDIGMYAPRRKAVKKAEISRLQVNPNSILQD